MQNHCW